MWNIAKDGRVGKSWHEQILTWNVDVGALRQLMYSLRVPKGIHWLPSCYGTAIQARVSLICTPWWCLWTPTQHDTRIPGCIHVHVHTVCVCVDTNPVLLCVYLLLLVMSLYQLFDGLFQWLQHCLDFDLSLRVLLVIQTTLPFIVLHMCVYRYDYSNIYINMNKNYIYI